MYEEEESRRKERETEAEAVGKWEDRSEADEGDEAEDCRLWALQSEIEGRV